VFNGLLLSPTYDALFDQGGRIMIMRGVEALGPVIVGQLIHCLQTYDHFDEGDDPYGEHDFGAFDHKGSEFFWKIDYYDLGLTFGSEDPSDPAKTTRVLTLMLAEEY
jgi:Protein of unknown function (DUF3768)